MSTDVPLKGKKLQQQLIVCLGLKCVFTKVTIYSDIHCMSGWTTYISWWVYCA